MSESAIVVEDVSKRFRLYHERNNSLKIALLRRNRATYEELWALRDVSFEVPAGSTFGLIGHNGSGKSTLLKCMARILRPDAGRIAVAGRVSALLELGAGFHPELSGRDNVYLNGSILGLSKKQLDARFDEIVGFAGLEDRIDTPVKNYSSGMYVRLGFSVAINVDPDVLLIDEVLAVGDEQFQRRCQEKFADLKGQGKTIVIVSHALGSVRTMCDQAAWLDHGVIKEIGPPGRLIDTYVDESHVERVVVEDAGTRWGSGEGRIERIELLTGAGRSRTRVRMGEPAVLRFHYVMDQPLPKPVFGFGLHRIDGVHATGLNSRESFVPDVLEGSGHVDFAIESMPLLPGTYDVTASLMDHANLHTWDFRNHAFRFDVEPGSPRECEGVAVIPGTWTLAADD